MCTLSLYPPNEYCGYGVYKHYLTLISRYKRDKKEIEMMKNFKRISF